MSTKKNGELRRKMLITAVATFGGLGIGTFAHHAPHANADAVHNSVKTTNNIDDPVQHASVNSGDNAHRDNFSGASASNSKILGNSGNRGTYINNHDIGYNTSNNINRHPHAIQSSGLNQAFYNNNSGSGMNNSVMKNTNISNDEIHTSANNKSDQTGVTEQINNPQMFGIKESPQGDTGNEAWTPSQLPSDLESYVHSPKRFGMSWKSNEGWANPDSNGQCVPFAVSYFEKIWGIKGSAQRNHIGTGGQVVGAFDDDSALKGHVSRTPHAGAIASTRNSVFATPSFGHTFVVEHVFSNGDYLIVEEDWPGAHGSGADVSKPKTWNYALISHKATGIKFFMPDTSKYKLGWNDSSSKPTPNSKKKGSNPGGPSNKKSSDTPSDGNPSDGNPSDGNPSSSNGKNSGKGNGSSKNSDSSITDNNNNNNNNNNAGGGGGGTAAGGGTGGSTAGGTTGGETGGGSGNSPASDPNNGNDPGNNPNNGTNPQNGQPNNSNPDNDNPNNVIAPNHHVGPGANNNNIVPSGTVINNNDHEHHHNNNGNNIGWNNRNNNNAAFIAALINNEDRDGQDSLNRLNQETSNAALRAAEQARQNAANSAAALSAAEQGKDAAQIQSMNASAGVQSLKNDMIENNIQSSIASNAAADRTSLKASINEKVDNLINFNPSDHGYNVNGNIGSNSANPSDNTNNGVNTLGGNGSSDQSHSGASSSPSSSSDNPNASYINSVVNGINGVVGNGLSTHQDQMSPMGAYTMNLMPNLSGFYGNNIGNGLNYPYDDKNNSDAYKDSIYGGNSKNDAYSGNNHLNDNNPYDSSDGLDGATTNTGKSKFGNHDNSAANKGNLSPSDKKEAYSDGYMAGLNGNPNDCWRYSSSARKYYDRAYRTGVNNRNSSVSRGTKLSNYQLNNNRHSSKDANTKSQLTNNSSKRTLPKTGDKSSEVAAAMATTLGAIGLAGADLERKRHS